jgi:hypothetical protein
VRLFPRAKVVGGQVCCISINAQEQLEILASKHPSITQALGVTYIRFISRSIQLLQLLQLLQLKLQLPIHPAIKLPIHPAIQPAIQILG